MGLDFPRVENQAKGEAAALHAFLKAQPGDLDDVLGLPHLPAHMHGIVRIMWQTRKEERRLPPVARAAPRRGLLDEEMMLDYDHGDEGGYSSDEPFYGYPEWM